MLAVVSTMRDRPLPADRLLTAATALFAQEGIRAVGIDRIIEEASVAKASLYQHYGSKDALVAAYLRAQDERDRAAYRRAVADVGDPVERILIIFDLAARAAAERGFRGCLYLNALTEFPNQDHPAVEVVRTHRDWLVRLWTEALTELGVPDPAGLTARLVVLYDGGLTGSKVAYTPEPIMLARQMAVSLIGSHF